MKKSDLDTGAGVSENKEKGQRKMTDTDAKYMKEAIRQAKKFVETNLIEEIVNNINCMEEKSND